jgi:outer membrane immunogenic protein
MLRKMSLGIAGAMAFAASVSAGGLKDVPVPEDPGWNGVYIGGHAGYGVGDAGTHATIDPAAVNPANKPVYNAAMSPGLHPSDLGAGGQIGFNWQSGRWVLGVEGSFGSLTLNDTIRRSAVAGTDALASTTKVDADWLGTVRGRLGWGNSFGFVYGTGGAAFTSLSYSQKNIWRATGAPNAVTYTETVSVSDTLAGWTYGGGVEYKFGPNWSGKVEYLHVDFGTVHGAGAIYNSPAGVLQANVAHKSDELTAEVVNVGLNYRLNSLIRPLN